MTLVDYKPPQVPAVRSQEPPLSPIEERPDISALWRGVIVTLVLFAGVASVWAAFIPMGSAVVSIGRIIVETNRKEIQSRQGGTVKAIHVEDGSKVAKGDLLIEFDRTDATASFDMADSQYLRSLFRRERFKAELRQSSVIAWPPEVEDRRNDELAQRAFATERRLLDSRKVEFDGELSVFKDRVVEMRERYTATEAKIRSSTEQLNLIREEADDVQILVDKGLARKPRLLALQVSIASMKGNIDDTLSSRAQLQVALSATLQQVENFKQKWRSDILAGLSQAERDAEDAFERRVSSKTLFDGAKVLAPEDGTIVNLSVNGPNEVVTPSETMMELVPGADDMIVLSQISPRDIDDIHPEQEVEVRLSAYHLRTINPVKGRLITVAADAIVNEVTGEAYYPAKVALDPDSLAEQPQIRLYPGMPADVIFITGKRSLFEYLASPITRYLYLSFRED
jgi:HlyD family type I secretion membrane fusion protein